MRLNRYITDVRPNDKIKNVNMNNNVLQSYLKHLDKVEIN